MWHFSSDTDAYFDDLMAGDHTYTIAAKIGEYTLPVTATNGWYFERSIISAKTTDTIFGNSNPCIGSVVASQIDLSIYVGDYTPEELSDERTQIWLSLQVDKTSDTQTRTMSAGLGPWYLDKINYDRMTGVLSVTGYDILADTDVEYMKCKKRTQYTSSSTATPLEVVQDIAFILGVSITPGTQQELSALATSTLQTVPKPDDNTTMRELLMWLAGACGCNVRATRCPDLGTSTVPFIEFVPFNGDGEVVDIGSKFTGLKINGLRSNSENWGVEMMGESETYGAYSTSSTAVFRMDNPLATDPGLACYAALTVYGVQAGNWDYQGFSAQNVILDLRAECGDMLHLEYPSSTGETVEELFYIGEISRTYDHACLCNVSAPNLAKQEVDTLYTAQS